MCVCVTLSVRFPESLCATMTTHSPNLPPLSPRRHKRRSRRGEFEGGSAGRLDDADVSNDEGVAVRNQLEEEGVEEGVVGVAIVCRLPRFAAEGAAGAEGANGREGTGGAKECASSDILPVDHHSAWVCISLFKKNMICERIDCCCKM